jgi:hypothetical protein
MERRCHFVKVRNQTSNMRYQISKI